MIDVLSLPCPTWYKPCPKGAKRIWLESKLLPNSPLLPSASCLLPSFDIVRVKLEPIDNEIYQENLKQTLQELTKKHEKVNIENITNPIVNKALNNKKSRPKLHQASLFDYLK